MEKDFEYRTIQSTGKGSYIITLPKEWVKDLSLGKGSHLAMRIQDDSALLLIPRETLEAKNEKSPQKKYRIFVEPKDNAESVCHKIISLYVISADSIYIRYKEGKIPYGHKVAINNLAKNVLLGSEIIDETSNELIIQVLVNHPEFPVEKAIRRMAIQALSADKDAAMALEHMDENLIKSVIESCIDVNRLGLYAIRQLKYGLERNLSKELGFRNRKEFLGYRLVVDDIKNIADNALNLANNIMALNKMIKDQSLLLNEPVDKEIYSQILKFNAKAHDFFDENLGALFKRDYDHADKLISEVGILVGSESELVTLVSTKKMDPNISSILRLIIDSSRRIIEYSRSISEVTLNRTIEEISELIQQ